MSRDPVALPIGVRTALVLTVATGIGLAREVRELQALVRRLDALIGMQTDERNRAQAGGLTAAVQDSIAAVLIQLEAHIASVRRQIRAHIDQHPDLRGQRDLLTTIPGIGETIKQFLGPDPGGE